MQILGAHETATALNAHHHNIFKTDPVSGSVTFNERSKPKKPNTPKNIIKGISYKTAFDRIKDATEKGFYFEAITLCESIISDRLLSFVKGMGDKNVDVRTGFHELISKSRKLQPDGSALWHDLDEWRKRRNACIHGFAKSEPSTPTKEVGLVLEDAEKAAKDGVALTRKVCNWHRQQLRKHLQASKKNLQK